MIQTYTVTQLAEIEGVSRVTMSQRVNNGDSRYLPFVVHVNSRSENGSKVYALTRDVLDVLGKEAVLNRVSDRLAINE